MGNQLGCGLRINEPAANSAHEPRKTIQPVRRYAIAAGICKQACRELSAIFRKAELSQNSSKRALQFVIRHPRFRSHIHCLSRITKLSNLLKILLP
jgi:hypothetical protein